MKQIFQSLKNGETFFIDTPSPRIKANEVLIKTEYSLISSGTERMLVDFGKGNILEKAKQQPDKVKEVIIDKLGVDEDSIKNEAHFVNDLGADSLDTVELIMELEEEFSIEIPDEKAETITTVGAAVDYIEKNQ